MNEPARFWFVHARNGWETVNMAVAAYTERQAKLRARKTLRAHNAADFRIVEAKPVTYAYAWVLNLTWKPKSVPPVNP